MADPTGAAQAPTDRRPTAAMLVIGDEILSGRTRDSNAHHLAKRLDALGVDLQEVRFIHDDAESIANAVRTLSAAVDHLFTSGGIGPTHDDITADAVAAAFGVRIDVRADARAILEAYYGAANLNEARLRMARIPEGATLIDNPVSHAPGFQLRNVYVMAGVPIIFEEMLKSLEGGLQGGPPILSWSLRADVREGDAAGPLGEAAARFHGVSLGVYPFHLGGLGVTAVVRGVDEAKLAAAAGEIRALLTSLGASEVKETPPRG